MKAEYKAGEGRKAPTTPETIKQDEAWAAAAERAMDKEEEAYDAWREENYNSREGML